VILPDTHVVIWWADGDRRSADGGPEDQQWSGSAGYGLGLRVGDRVTVELLCYIVAVVEGL
jgi:hypothetical protein